MEDITGVVATVAVDSGSSTVRDAQVFLSHASDDAEAARTLARHLRANGVGVWLDLDEIKPGDAWMDRLEQGLSASDHYAIYIGRLGVANWVSCELRVALDRNTKDKTFRIIPILGPGADPATLPLFLRQHHWLDLRDKSADPASIVKHIQNVLGLPEHTAPSGEAPFIGLNAFDSEHAHLFFGREREIAELLEKVGQAPFITMIGDSGSGKSSLLRAGLIPSLRSGSHTTGTSDRSTWQVALLRPGAKPFVELANALANMASELETAERLKISAQCHTQLTSDPNGLALCLGTLASSGQRTLIAIDQFEEMFTLVPDEETRQRFIAALLQAANSDSVQPIHVVITLRADFYAECLRYEDLGQALTNAQYAVRPVEGERLVEIMVKPAARTGVKLENGLVQAILADLGSQAPNLPLLEHTLLQLWTKRSGTLLTHASYEAIGRVQGALENHAEEAFSAFTAREKLFVQKIFLKLVQPGRIARATSKRVDEKQLLAGALAHPNAASVLAQLVKRRLVSIYTAADREEYGISHEALLEGWQRLKLWLNEDREFLLWRQRLDSDLADWLDAGRDPGGLIRGARLAEAMRWSKQRSEDIGPGGLAFINASVSRSVRLRWIANAAVTSLVLLTVVATGAAYLASTARSQAESSLQTATAAVDSMLTRVGSDLLKDVPQLESIRKDLLHEARTLYTKLAEQHARNPDLQLQAAVAPARVADIDRQLGNFTSAITGLESAIIQLEHLAADNGGDEIVLQIELAGMQGNLGRVLEAVAQTRDEALLAEARFSEAIDMQQSLLDIAPDNQRLQMESAQTFLNRAILYKDKLREPDKAQLDLLTAIAMIDSPGTPDSDFWNEKAQHLARSNNTLANLLAEQNAPDRAISHYELAADYFQLLSDQNPSDREYQLELAKTYNNIATLHMRSSPASSEASDKALTFSNMAIALFSSLANPLPEINLELANAYDVGGRIFLQSENYLQAELLFRSGDQLLIRLLDEFPANNNYKLRHAVLLTNLGFSQIRSSQFNGVPDTQRRLSSLVAQLPADNRSQLESQGRYQVVRTWN